MKTKPEYYTPDISEFKYNFDYEVKYGENWEKIRSPLMMDWTDIQPFLPKGVIRSKRLDQQDLEELGWVKIMNCDNKFMLGEEYILTLKPHSLTIQKKKRRHFGDIAADINVRNKSEMSVLMRQYSINQ